MENLGPGKAFGVGGLVAKLCLILASPWTIAHQASLSMGFSRQEYLSGLPLPSPGDRPDQGIEPTSPALHPLPLKHQESPPPLLLLSCFSRVPLCVTP